MKLHFQRQDSLPTHIHCKVNLFILIGRGKLEYSASTLNAILQGTQNRALLPYLFHHIELLNNNPSLTWSLPIINIPN